MLLLRLFRPDPKVAGYVTAVRHVFRQAVYTGKAGRPRLVTERGGLMRQVVKQHARRPVVSVTHWIVKVSAAAIGKVLSVTGGRTRINTALIERLNGMFRAALAPLVRRWRRN